MFKKTIPFSSISQKMSVHTNTSGNTSFTCTGAVLLRTRAKVSDTVIGCPCCFRYRSSKADAVYPPPPGNVVTRWGLGGSREGCVTIDKSKSGSEQ